MEDRDLICTHMCTKSPYAQDMFPFVNDAAIAIDSWNKKEEQL
jgi:hypothetical protein